MEKILFVYGWLALLTDGRFFRTLFSGLLRLTAIAITIFLIGDTIEFTQRLSTPAAEGSLILPILAQMTLLLAGYTIAHLLLLRAAEIRSLYNPLYTLSEIVTVLARLSGEMLFVTILAITLLTLMQIEGVELAPWMALFQEFFAPVLKQHAEIWIAVGGVTLSLALLVAGYLASELLEMLLRLSRNSEKQNRSQE